MISNFYIVIRKKKKNENEENIILHPNPEK